MRVIAADYPTAVLKKRFKDCTIAEWSEICAAAATGWPRVKVDERWEKRFLV
jgi:hypothetical protein